MGIGMVRKRFVPAVVLMLASLLCGLGWVPSAFADSAQTANVEITVEHYNKGAANQYVLAVKNADASRSLTNVKGTTTIPDALVHGRQSASVAWKVDGIIHAGQVAYAVNDDGTTLVLDLEAASDAGNTGNAGNATENSSGSGGTDGSNAADAGNADDAAPDGRVVTSQSHVESDQKQGNALADTGATVMAVAGVMLLLLGCGCILTVRRSDNGTVKVTVASFAVVSIMLGSGLVLAPQASAGENVSFTARSSVTINGRNYTLTSEGNAVVPSQDDPSVAVIGLVKDRQGSIMKSADLTLSVDNSSKTVSTDDDGYVNMHLRRGYRYTLQSTGLQVVLIADDVNSIAVNNVSGSLQLGRQMKDDTATTTTRDSVVYVPSEGYVESADQGKVTVTDSSVDILVGDTVVLAPKGGHDGGLITVDGIVASQEGRVVTFHEAPLIEGLASTEINPTTLDARQVQITPAPGVEVTNYAVAEDRAPVSRMALPWPLPDDISLSKTLKYRDSLNLGVKCESEECKAYVEQCTGLDGYDDLDKCGDPTDPDKPADKDDSDKDDSDKDDSDKDDSDKDDSDKDQTDGPELSSEVSYDSHIGAEVAVQGKIVYYQPLDTNVSVSAKVDTISTAEWKLKGELKPKPKTLAKLEWPVGPIAGVSVSGELSYATSLSGTVDLNLTTRDTYELGVVFDKNGVTPTKNASKDSNLTLEAKAEMDEGFPIDISLNVLKHSAVAINVKPGMHEEFYGKLVYKNGAVDGKDTGVGGEVYGYLSATYQFPFMEGCAEFGPCHLVVPDEIIALKDEHSFGKEDPVFKWYLVEAKRTSDVLREFEGNYLGFYQYPAVEPLKIGADGSVRVGIRTQYRDPSSSQYLPKTVEWQDFTGKLDANVFMRKDGEVYREYSDALTMRYTIPGLSDAHDGYTLKYQSDRSKLDVDDYLSPESGRVQYTFIPEGTNQKDLDDDDSAMVKIWRNPGPGTQYSDDFVIPENLITVCNTDTSVDVWSRCQVYAPHDDKWFSQQTPNDTFPGADFRDMWKFD